VAVYLTARPERVYGRVAAQAVKSWVAKPPVVTADVVRRYTAANGLSRSPGDVLRHVMPCDPEDAAGFGVLKGLQTLYLCGNTVPRTCRCSARCLCPHALATSWLTLLPRVLVV
jgi:hypothetical protein